MFLFSSKITHSLLLYSVLASSHLLLVYVWSFIYWLLWISLSGVSTMRCCCCRLLEFVITLGRLCGWTCGWVTVSGCILGFVGVCNICRSACLLDFLVWGVLLVCTHFLSCAGLCGYSWLGYLGGGAGCDTHMTLLVALFPWMHVVFCSSQWFPSGAARPFLPWHPCHLLRSSPNSLIPLSLWELVFNCLQIPINCPLGIAMMQICCSGGVVADSCSGAGWWLCSKWVQSS